MRIVYICNEYPPGKTGGIGVFTKRLAESMVTAGHLVTVVGFYPGLLKERQEVINGVRIIRLLAKTGFFGLFINRLRLYRQLKTLSKEKPIDIIECPDFEAPMAYLPKMANKLLTRLHGSHTYFSVERKLKVSTSIRHLENRQLHSSDYVVSVSRYTAQVTHDLFFLKKMPDVIYNSVDVSATVQYIKNDYSTNKKVIYFGTVVEKKGVFSLASAWKVFKKDNPEWELSIIGKDTTLNGESSIGKMKSLLGDVVDSVKFIEHIDNDKLINSLKEYDFCVLPSYTEAFSLAPMEAMSVGLPVVISSLSSGVELVDHGVDGWLCDPGDISTIIDALEIAASSEQMREKIGIAGRNKINKYFNFDDFVKINLNYYSFLIKGNSSL